MRRFSILISIAFSLVFSFSMCRKGLELASWDVDVIAPVATGSVNFSDYLPEDFLNESSAFQLNLIASDTLIKLGLDTLIGLPDTTIKDTFLVPISLQFPAGVPFYTSQKLSRYKIRDVQLTKAIIKESEIFLKIRNTLDKPILFNYKILNATINGTQVFEVEERVDAKSTFEQTYEMNGYTLDLRGLDKNDYNSIVSEFNVMIHPSLSGTVTINPGQILLENTVKDVVPQYIEGYFGNEHTTINQTNDISVFDQFKFKSLDITQFDVTMTIDNGIGADLQLVIDRLGSTNLETSSSADLEHSIIGSSILFTRAINLHNEANPVKHVQKKFEFNELNSNLDELLELRPSQVTSDLSIVINPLGNISLGNDFVYFGHNLSAVMDLRVPLIVSAGGVELNDTADFKFNYQGKETDRINFGQLNVLLDNGYPLDAKIQLYLIDSSGTVLDSLFAQAALIEGAEEESGVVKTLKHSTISIPIDQDLISSLSLTSQIQFNATLNTTGTDAIHLRKNSRIDFTIVADLNVSTGK